MQNQSCRLVILGSLLLFLLAIALPAPVVAQTQDKVIGTWTLIPAKSTFTPGPALKSGKVTFEEKDGPSGVRVIAELIDEKGTTTRSDYAANYDGKPVAVTGVAGVEMTSLKKIDANSVQRTDTMGGKVVQTYTRKISADGKTMTVIHKGTGTDGKPFSNTLYFEKQ